MNEFLPLISVIVPVYKVEPYLRRCVDSILTQTYSNLEVILVDDGSPDLCPQICDEYANVDQRVKVIHKENGGQASARNVALDICKGEYISFVDSDDFVSECFIDAMYSAVSEGNTDIAMTSFSSFHEETEVMKISSVGKTTNKVKPLDEIMELCSSLDLFEHMIVNCCWNKLYRKTLFDNVRFPEGKIYEDTATTYKLLFKCPSVVYVDKTLYHYYLRPGSTSSDKPFSLQYLDCLDALNSSVDWFIDQGNVKYASYIVPRLLMTGLYSWWGVKYVLRQPERADEILSTLRKKSENTKTTHYFSALQKICLLSFLRFPILYVAYRKVTSGVVGRRC